MVQFLDAYLIDILSFLETVLFVIVSISLTNKLKNPDYLLGAFELFMKKYKIEQNITKPVGQKFEHTAPVYEVNSDSGELVKTDKVINIDELVNSSKDQSLNSIYDRFLPDDTERFTAVFDNHNSREVTLQSMRESLALVEDYRVKYKLPDDMEPLDVLSYVEKSAKKMKEKNDLLKSEIEKKGGEGNA